MKGLLAPQTRLAPPWSYTRALGGGAAADARGVGGTDGGEDDARSVRGPEDF